MTIYTSIATSSSLFFLLACLCDFRIKPSHINQKKGTAQVERICCGRVRGIDWYLYILKAKGKFVWVEGQSSLAVKTLSTNWGPK